MEKKNTGLIVLVIVLSIAVLGLGGFIVYDKVLSKESLNNNDSVNKNENKENNEVEYIESFISEDYIIPLLNSLTTGNKPIDETIVIETLYNMFSEIRTSNEYFENFNIQNFNLSPFIVEQFSPDKTEIIEQNIKEYNDFTIYYISEQNLSNITQKVFNCDFNKIKQKFINQMKTDPFSVFGEYNNGYIFAIKPMGRADYFYKFVNNKFINDSKIYTYDIYCSLLNDDGEGLGNIKIGEVQINSKYNKVLQSYIFTEYNYKIDESIDTNNCYFS